MLNLYKNPVFGKSLISDDCRNITKNYLYDKIINETNFGIFNLHNIKSSSNTFYDISIILKDEPSEQDLYLLNRFSVGYQKKAGAPKISYKGSANQA